MQRVLYIRKLTYENIGDITWWSGTFSDDFTYVEDEAANVTLCVLRLVMGDVTACDGMVGEDSRVQAQVQIGKQLYKAEIAFPAGAADFSVTDEAGRSCMLWYMQTAVHPREEQKLNCFVRPGVYPARLKQYRNCPEAFRDATATIAVTQTFRCYLRKFIKKFRPKKMLPQKQYWLHLENDGSFVVRLGKDGQIIDCLSETESYVYHYWCFLCLLDFWSGMEKLRNYKDVKLPILIKDFTDRIDESVATQQLYAKAGKRKRQVLVLKE